MAKIASQTFKRPVELPVLDSPRVAALPRTAWTQRDDVRLFAMTFIGGFVFTSLFIA